MQVRWSGRALSDLEALQDYLLERNLPAARQMVSILRGAAESLAAMAHRGRPGRWPGTRELIIPGHAYLIPYRVQGEVIEILRVFHGARRWPSRADE